MRDTMGIGFRIPIGGHRRRAGAALPGARPLVVHDHRGRDVRDADAGPRRRPARHASPRRRRPSPAPSPGRRHRAHRPRPPLASRRRGAGLVPRAARAVSHPARAARRRRDGSPWPTPPTSSAGPFPTAARTSRWPPPSRSAACSACRSCRSSPPCCASAREQFGAGRVREILDRGHAVRAARAARRARRPGPVRRPVRARRAGRRPRGALRAAPAGGRSRPRARACAASSTRSSPAGSASTSTRCARPATPSASSPRSPRPTSRSPR